MSDEHVSPRITLRISSQKGVCGFGHKVGQEFDVTGCTPAGMCPLAYHSAYPYIWALSLGGEMYWEKDKNFARIACPDADNPVFMELRREAKK
jgi:uncharacterized repeat protein (TIGR04076 family)